LPRDEQICSLTICQLLEIGLGAIAKYVWSWTVQRRKDGNDPLAGKVETRLTVSPWTLIVPACDDVLVEVGKYLSEVVE
jgi:hypothetical protein